ncbi:MAG TPA: hypothetical protein ENO14_03870 [Chromatiales bacterium]|nr:hypothetical protein [Chromatiales bacterium]
MLNGHSLNGAALNGSAAVGVRALAGEAVATATLSASPAFIRSAHVDALATASGADTVLFRTTDGTGSATATAFAYNNATRFQRSLFGDALAETTASGYSEATVNIYGSARGEASLDGVFGAIVMDGAATATATATAKADWLQRIYGDASASADASIPALDVTRNMAVDARPFAYATGEPAVNDTLDARGVAASTADAEADLLVHALMASDASSSCAAGGYLARRIKAYGSTVGLAEIGADLAVKPGLVSAASADAIGAATLYRTVETAGEAVAEVIARPRLARTAYSMGGNALASANAQSALDSVIRGLGDTAYANAYAEADVLRVAGLNSDSAANADAIGGLLTNVFARAPLFRTVLVPPGPSDLVVAPDDTEMRVA